MSYEEQIMSKDNVPYRDPPASDLLALHALVFPLSFPFGRLPRRLSGEGSLALCRLGLITLSIDVSYIPSLFCCSVAKKVNSNNTE